MQDVPSELLDHPTEEVVSRFVEGALEGEELARFEEHTVECVACRSLLLALSEDDDGRAGERGNTLPLPPSEGAAGAPALLPPGRLVGGRFRIVRLLGRGGMGTVYEAIHSNGRRVALKVLHAHLRSDPEIARRFVREGHATNRIDHPGVVTIVDDGTTDDGSPFLVLELLLGRSLAALVHEKGPRPWTELERLLEEALSILEHAHAAGVVHRDVKPENFFLTEDGRLKLLDFGIARVAEPSTHATEVGTSLGTPAFMSPEQARGDSRSVDARSDLFSLAATFIWLASGKRLFEADNGRNLAYRIASEEAPPVHALCRTIPRRAARVLERALRRRPEDRFESARGFREALRAPARSPIVLPIGISALVLLVVSVLLRERWGGATVVNHEAARGAEAERSSESPRPTESVTPLSTTSSGETLGSKEPGPALSPTAAPSSSAERRGGEPPSPQSLALRRARPSGAHATLASSAGAAASTASTAASTPSAPALVSAPSAPTAAGSVDYYGFRR